MSTKTWFFPRLALGLATMLSVIALAGCALQTPKTQADTNAEVLARAKAGAESGNAEDQYFYGVYLLRQNKDFVGAHAWFLKSAQGGNRYGQELLAGDYLTGRGVTMDLALAVSWMKKSADQGNPSAQYSLAQMYGQGYGVPRNQAKQLDLLEKAAMQQDSDALRTLAQMGDPHGVVQQANAKKAAETQAALERYRNLQMQQAAPQQYSQPEQQQMCSVNNGQVTYLRPC
jgi:TPR repeat protein